MPLQHVVFDRVAVFVENDPVDRQKHRLLPQDSTGVITWSASISRRSSFIGESTFGLATNIAKTSPDSARAIRMVRSFSGQADGVGPLG